MNWFKKDNLVNNFFNLLDILFYSVTLGLIVMLIGFCINTYCETPISGVVEPVKKTLAVKEWDWIALIIAFFSLIIGYITFNSQNKTERNTMRITPESQKQILIDYIRHYYRNLVIICAVEAKLKDRFNEYYPSQEHLLKLKVSLEDLHPAAFYNHSEKYRAIHELLTKMRNFNTEVDTATLHLCDKNVFDKAKKRDFATLKFKMCYLSAETLDTICALWIDSYDKVNDNNNNAKAREQKAMIVSEVKEMLAQALMSYNKKEMEKAKEELGKEEDKTPYFKQDTFYTKTIFSSKEEKEEFFLLLNCNIHTEIKARSSNEFGESEKILLIPF